MEWTGWRTSYVRTVVSFNRGVLRRWKIVWHMASSHPAHSFSPSHFKENGNPTWITQTSVLSLAACHRLVKSTLTLSDASSSTHNPHFHAFNGFCDTKTNPQWKLKIDVKKTIVILTFRLNCMLNAQIHNHFVCQIESQMEFRYATRTNVENWIKFE